MDERKQRSLYEVEPISGIEAIKEKDEVETLRGYPEVDVRRVKHTGERQRDNSEIRRKFATDRSGGGGGGGGAKLNRADISVVRDLPRARTLPDIDTRTFSYLSLLSLSLQYIPHWTEVIYDRVALWQRRRLRRENFNVSYMSKAAIAALDRRSLNHSEFNYWNQKKKK